ncbi:MAG: lipid-A-disaccharide synthase, partial [Pseudomonadota bacterium]
MKIMISAGEASGDMHAASALQQLKALSKGRSVEAFGMGGKRLADCGMELLVDTRDHAVMGLVEVLHKYPQLRANLNSLKRAIKDRKPDVLLLVDYPHFNMKLAAEAKALDVPVMYYIAPKVWASRAGRVQELAECVDQMAVIFPFEVDIFEKAGIKTRYVGNPVLENKSLVQAQQQ